MSNPSNEDMLPGERNRMEIRTYNECEALLKTLVRVATILRNTEIPFALTGGCAVYARGGPASDHDVDILVRQQDCQPAVQALEAAGMTSAQPPEDWLLKAFDGDRLIDLIHHPNERPVTDETLRRAEPIRVGSVTAPVMPATDLVVEKLLVLGPHRCDYTELLPAVRALREQIDWTAVREQTIDSPYAEAFLLLVERLGIVPTEATWQECRGGNGHDEKRASGPAVRGSAIESRAG